MINISVFSSSNISIEQEEFHIDNQDDMVRFLKTLLDKVYYAGEQVCLEKATIDEAKGLVNFQEIDRWR